MRVRCTRGAFRVRCWCRWNSTIEKKRLSAPKTAKVEALRRFVEEQGRGKYALCDEHGRYRWSRAHGSDKDSVLDPTKTLEDFFEPQLRRGEPIVAWFVSFRE